MKNITTITLDENLKAKALPILKSKGLSLSRYISLALAQLVDGCEIKVEKVVDIQKLEGVKDERLGAVKTWKTI